MSDLTIWTEKNGEAEDAFHTFELAVISDDHSIDEGWTVRQEIIDEGGSEIQTFWYDPEARTEWPASPVDVMVRDEIEKLTGDAFVAFFGR